MYRKAFTAAIKISISLGIVAYLVYDASRTKNGVNVFENLRDGHKNWSMLAAGLAVFATGITLTFVRWWVLVRALGVPVRLRDSIRIGFWGFLFNLAPLGTVGGDLVKAVMLSREQHTKQASVVASVIVDRIIGLYILFVFATIAILLTGFNHSSEVDIVRVCNLVFLVTGVATAGIITLFTLNAAAGHWLHLLHGVPIVGKPVAHLLEDMRLYRHRLPALLGASLITFVIHGCSSVAYYFIACGLPGEVPPLNIHFVIVPLSISSGVIPLPMGPLELVLEFFYMHLPMCPSIVKGQGLLVALVSRLNGIIVAFTGVLLYIRNRGEVAEVIHSGGSAESLPEES